MKQVLIKQGQVILEDVPTPQVEAGKVLVQVRHSCISAGTEMSGVKASGTPLWKRALQQPEKVRTVIDMAMNQGIGATAGLMQQKVSSTFPTGYSAAGIVIEVGEGVKDLRIGDPVACAGAQCAHHAEIICVPPNLVVPVPEPLDFTIASTVTLGAIALQGVRRAHPTLGETFVVIGLGILGQITTQLLKCNGCRVIGTDLSKARITQALELGMDVGVHPDDNIPIEQVRRLTDGIGADGVIITAATPSDEVIATAFQMCRKKGRVVLVGDVGLHLNRADFYQKELDFFISTSYGPGRYDQHYEEEGLDYPVGYVRWTENRNMREYLRLLGSGKVTVRPLISSVYSIAEVSQAYESLQSESNKPLMVLLSYPDHLESPEPLRVIPNPEVQDTGTDRIRIALIGAGGFAKSTHIPNIKALSEDYQLQTVVSRKGHNAKTTAQQSNAVYAATDYREVLSDQSVDAVLIATRHNTHFRLSMEALKAGKHVLVEKPPVITKEELEEIVDFYGAFDSQQSAPLLMTGFNRRFSRYARYIYEILQNRSNPVILNYRMNAGYIPLDHWVHTEEGGGRNIGEACHIYDLFTFFTNSKVLTVQAQAIKPATGYYSHQDNFVATMTFEDGSVATLTYTALGFKDYPKEQFEIFVDGKVLVLSDYKRLSLVGLKAKGIESRIMGKGHKEELEVFAQAIQHGGEWPIPLWQQVQAMEIAFQVEACLMKTG